MKVYTKKEIKYMQLSEGNDYVVFNKKHLKLREDTKDTAFADNLDDLDDAKNDSTTNDVVIDKSSTDDEISTNEPTLSINAKNVSDAKTQIKQQNHSALGKQLKHANYAIHFESKNYSKFSKKELNEYLKNM